MDCKYSLPEVVSLFDQICLFDQITVQINPAPTKNTLLKDKIRNEAATLPVEK